MLDSGGSSGRLRRDYNVVSPGDIRRALIALANTSPVVESLFDYRFKFGELAGHHFANLLITALELSSNNYEEALGELKKILNIKHQVLPVTLEKSNLFATLEDGTMVEGETNIDIPKHNGALRIKKIYLRPETRAYPPALKAIRESDLIVIGPGDLYSSIAQILLVKGVSESILKSKAKKIYICNLMTKYGETNNFSVSDFTNQIENWLRGELDFVLYNNFFPKEERFKKFKKEHPELMDMVRVDKRLSSKKFIGKNLIFDEGLIEHDPEKIAKILYGLV
jgi:uncharacterized cofD-like protein